MKPVVVGIDGSEQALSAASWAVGEAVGRGVPLRLLYVIRTDLLGSLTAEQYRCAVEEAKAALHAARAAVEQADDRVLVETDIAQGNPAGVLESESGYATMICLGSSGIGRVGIAFLGSTAASVAEQALCPVAIVRSPNLPKQAGQLEWVMVPVSVFVDNDIIETGIEQARLLNRPVLAVGVWRPEFGGTPSASLDTLVTQWQERFPDVRIHPVATESDMSHFLRQNPDVGGLVVTDAATAHDVAALVGGERSGREAQVERTVLVVHRRATTPAHAR
ncbi:universal stress protein [Mycolicibacterium lacusdiani]|uniref:universal stress protein n=1 Tax=Mycolicibacterium lacusdiani TaxID=2895283 RepID=UPI001F36E729|nr:universal stress protein [Mycolicibacterium lacusdiani]